MPSRIHTSLFSALAALALSACSEAPAPAINTTPEDNPWYRQGAKAVAETDRQFRQLQHGIGSAKNIILFVGDGMGIATLTAARILEGQNRGLLGEENSLSFEQFPHSGLIKTYNVDAQTPDSAGTMTAMVSGVKTDAGIIGLHEAAERGDCASAQGREVISALELAEVAGMATGIVSSARITHATPAATYAKSADRNWESSAPEGCEDIASQLVHFAQRLEQRVPGANSDGIELVMGGGRSQFLPREVTDIEGKRGKRQDQRNLVELWQQQYPEGHYLETAKQFAAFAANSEHENGPVLALFNPSHMRYEADRSNDIGGEPSLKEMTALAVERLEREDRGYFLMVESGRIDHGHHAGNAANALYDTIEFAKAVEVADTLSGGDTLILVTADHSHVFTMAGYPKRGNPILGKVVSIGEHEAALAEDGLPYTTLSYANGRGFAHRGEHSDADARYALPIKAGRQDIRDVNSQALGYHQEALVPLGAETHAGEDVALYARGPGAHLANGNKEQSLVFHIMNYAADLQGRAARALQRGKQQ